MNKQTMSVFPEFIQHIHDMGLYEAGYNYEEMYNIMIYNLTYNIISTNHFIYTYAQMNMLYDYLEELLGSNLEDSDVEIEETNVEPTYPVNNINTINQNTNTNDINQDAMQLLNNYIINAINNATQNNLYANINPMNINTNTNTNPNPNEPTNNEFTYTNLIYYNNT